MSKLNIVVDGNNHFHKSLYATGNYSKGRMLGTQKDKDMYIRKIAMDLAYAIRFFGAPDRIIFTMDAYSWRKDVPIDQNDGYKANRVRDNSAVDWDAFNEVNLDFFNILADKGFICSNLTGCEGDDLMYFWQKKFYEDGEDVVIISGDGDISQLVKYNEKNFVCVFNTKLSERKIVGALGFGDWLDKKLAEPVNVFDVFMTSDFVPSSYDIIKRVINSTRLLEVEPTDVIFEKIICGDSGDNIPSIWTWETSQKNGKIINNKISWKKASQIREMIIEHENNIDVHNLSRYIDIFIKGIKKTCNKDADEQIVKKRLERNTQLVILSHDTIPIIIQNQFEKHYINYKEQGAPKLTKMDMQSLLENSKYWNGPKTIEADIFASVNPDNIKSNKASKSLF